MVTIHERADALHRSVRSGAQALALVALVGAGTAVDQLAGSGETLTLETVAGSAALGAAYSASAWVHRRLEAARDQRRRDRDRESS